PDQFEFRARFDQEVRALRTLSHPNIIKLLDEGLCDRGPYYVMEYLSGGTLHERKKRMSVDAKIAAIEQITNALEHAHANGITHRDLKPDNVLFDASGNVKVGDFGCLRWAGHSLNLTRPGLGTPGYCAPEQAEHGDADERSDLYSLGALILQVFYGDLPSYNARHELLKWTGYDNTPPVMRDLIIKLLQWDARYRHQDVHAFRKAFRLVADELRRIEQERARERAESVKQLLKVAGITVAVCAGIFVAVAAVKAIAKSA
ncbi:MAG TPA: serine/threonine-protein kinase, partial [Planctomycetota bacterium]|nr:serine/threonine-protein kinase [Planctomycetota bacterium]